MRIVILLPVVMRHCFRCSVYGLSRVIEFCLPLAHLLARGSPYFDVLFVLRILV